MKRGSFLKSIFAIAIAPAIATKVIEDNPIPKKEILKTLPEISTQKIDFKSTGNLVSDLRLLTPHYYKQYVERYGDELFTDFLTEYTHSKI